MHTPVQRILSIIEYLIPQILSDIQKLTSECDTNQIWSILYKVDDKIIFENVHEKVNRSKDNQMRSKFKSKLSAQQGDMILLYCLCKVDFKKLTPYRHLHLIEGILQDIICVQFIDDFQESFHVLCPRLTDHKELCSCQKSNHSF